MFEVRSRSWLTPARPPTQLPVARACKSRWVSRSGRIAEEILSSRRRAYERSSWYFRSFTRFAEGQLEDGAGDAAEEDRLLDPILAGVSQVREKAAVEDRLDLLDAILLRLARRELLLEVVDRVVPREDAVRRVVLLVLALLDVRVDDVRHLGSGDDRVVDVLVLLHAERLHQDDQRDLARGGRNAHDELPDRLGPDPADHPDEGAR